MPQRQGGADNREWREILAVMERRSTGILPVSLARAGPCIDRMPVLQRHLFAANCPLCLPPPIAAWTNAFPGFTRTGLFGYPLPPTGQRTGQRVYSSTDRRHESPPTKERRQELPPTTSLSEIPLMCHVYTFMVLALLGATPPGDGQANGPIAPAGDGFRIENTVYAGDQKEPPCESTTIFHGGMVYDCMKTPAETIVLRAGRRAVHSAESEPPDADRTDNRRIDRVYRPVAARGGQEFRSVGEVPRRAEVPGGFRPGRGQS